MTKEQLSKLVHIENEESNKYLEEFTINEKNIILNSETNDDILKHLDLLKIVCIKNPKIIIETLEYLFKKIPFTPITIESGFGDLEGKTHTDVILESLNILKSLRYYDIEKTILISFSMYKNGSKEIQSLAIKLIEEFTEYNPEVLSKIGLYPQIKMLDFIEDSLKNKKQEEDLFLVNIILHKIFETSSMTFSLTSPDTISLISGDVPGDKEIFKVRKRALRYTIEIYKKLDSLESKVSFFTIFNEACRIPMNSSNESDLGMSIQENRKEILSNLKEIFIKNKKIVQPFALCLHFDNLLYWQFIHLGLQKDIALEIRDLIYQDKDYELFNRFVHDDSHRSYARKNKNFTTIEDHINSYVTLTKDKKEDILLEELSNIAKQAIFVDEWKFYDFKQLLNKISEKYPEKMFKIANEALIKRGELSNKYFLPWILSGIRSSFRYDLWDNIAYSTLETKDVTLTAELIGSIFISQLEKPEINIREKEDINILINLVHRKNNFSFLKDKKTDYFLCHFTINSLRASYPISPKKIELLIIKEIKNNNDYFFGYIQTINSFEEQLNIKQWSPTNKKFLLNKFSKIDDLDWHIQNLLPSLCEKPKDVIALFLKRIKIKNKKLDNNIRNKYEAVPYSINPDLFEYVNSETDDEKIDLIIKKLPSKYTAESIDIARLIKNFKIDSSDILKKLSKDKKISDAIIKKVVISISSIDSPDIDFLVELAGKTSSESLHKSIHSRLASTGVVSGEFGIANAYREKWISLERYIKTENKNTKKFLDMSIRWLKDSEDRSRKEANEDIERRRIDFENNHSK